MRLLATLSFLSCCALTFAHRNLKRRADSATVYPPNGTYVEHRQYDKSWIYYNCSKPNTVALTFDDGPYNYFYDISKTLLAHNAKGTFFVNGNNYGCIYSETNVKRLQYAYKSGHQIASHSWTHEDLTTLTEAKMNKEFELAHFAFKRILGLKPLVMRPPFDLVYQVSKKRGQKMILWDFYQWDADGAPPSLSKYYYDLVIKQHPKSILTLNHEPYSTTAHNVLPYAIEKLQKAGYKLVTLTECMNGGEKELPMYKYLGKPEKRTADWKCT